MSIYVVVDGAGAIVNRILLDDAGDWSPGDDETLFAEASVAMDIGGTYLDGVYTPPEQDELPFVPVVPQSISDRQFFQQLAIDGIISEDDALASNAAVIPAPLLAIINQLPADQRFAAKMKVSGATTFYRTDPLTIAIGTAYGMSAEQVEAFFAAAAVL